MSEKWKQKILLIFPFAVLAAGMDTLGTRNPEAIHIASLLVKPEKLKVNLNIEYVAMEIPNDFIVGYGLDYDGFGRNYPDIYTVVD